MDPAAIEALIEDQIPDAEATVRTRSDHPEDDHYEATVIAPAFEGCSLVEQHELVYGALEGHMTKDIHALELTTRSPDQA